MKIFNKNKHFLIRTIVNLIIIACVMSVFSVCFNVSGITAVSSSGYKAIYRGNENNPNASLMINIYWGTEYVADMLATLKETDSKATFFVGGMWASENSDLLKQIYNDGHEIANHGYYHKDHKTISLEKNLSEISTNHKLVKGLINVDMTLFMPPSGSFGENTLSAAENLGYKTIMWSKDTIDWRDHDTNLIVSRATKNMQNGDLILMHPTECTKNALRQIITCYKNSGFNLVTVSENIL